MYKKCSTCKELKLLDAFYKSKKEKDGKMHKCKECSKSYSRKYLLSKESTWADKLYWTAYRNNQIKQLPFNLTTAYIQEIIEKQDYKCYWTNLSLLQTEPNVKPYDPLKPSLDRLVPSLGYVENNIVVTLWIINRMRGDMNVECFTSFFESIKTKLKKSCLILNFKR